MQLLEVSGVVRLIHRSLGVKGLIYFLYATQFLVILDTHSGEQPLVGHPRLQTQYTSTRCCHICLQAVPSICNNRIHNSAVNMEVMTMEILTDHQLNSTPKMKVLDYIYHK